MNTKSYDYIYACVFHKKSNLFCKNLKSYNIFILTLGWNCKYINIFTHINFIQSAFFFPIIMTNFINQ